MKEVNKQLADKLNIPVPTITLPSANLPPSEPRSTVETKEEHSDDDIISYTGSFVEKKKKRFTPNPLAKSWTPARKAGSDMKTSAGSQSSQNTTHAPRGAPLYPRSESTQKSTSSPRGAPLYPPSESTKISSNTPRGAALNPRSESNYGPSQPGTQTPKHVGPYFAPVPSISEASSDRADFPPGPPSFPSVKTSGRAVYPQGSSNAPFGSSNEDALGNPDAVRPWVRDDIYSNLGHLYNLIMGIIVNMFRNGTPNVPDNMLPVIEKMTWAYLLEMVYPGKPEGLSHMKFLLGVKAFRPYILQRMILDYIFRKVLSPAVFLGFSPEMDSHLSALQKQIQGFISKSLPHTSPALRKIIRDITVLTCILLRR